MRKIILATAYAILLLIFTAGISLAMFPPQQLPPSGIVAPGPEESNPTPSATSTQEPLQVHSVSASPSRPAPGEKVTVKFKVENYANETIEDIDLTVDFDGLEDAKGKEITADKTFSLSKGKSRKIEFTFNMPYNIEDDESYTININLEGNGKDTGKDYAAEDSTEEITFKKQANALAIESFTISPSTLSCNSKAAFKYTIRNIGTNDQNAVVNIVNSELGIEHTKNLQINEGDAVSNSVNLAPVLAPGVYEVALDVAYGSNRGSKTAELKINDCDTLNEKTATVEETVQSTISSPVVTNYASQTTPTSSNQITGFAAATQKKADFAQSDEYIMLLVIVFILLLGIVIYTIGAAIILLKR